MKLLPELLVNVPVADLRREPRFSGTTYGKDLLQETQLLLGERLRFVEENGEWIYVEALEQMRHSAIKGWQGYHGWLPRSCTVPVASHATTAETQNLVVTALWAPIFEKPTIGSQVIMDVSLGTYLASLCPEGAWWKVCLPDGKQGYVASGAVTLYPSFRDKSLIIGKIVAESQKFLGSPYHWGGRSAYRPAKVPLTGVDCSGLSNLLYRLQGIDIPRDAHDQFLKCYRKSSGKQLVPGDLIFSIEEGSASGRVDHVMVYIGGDNVVEATLTYGQVKHTNIKEKSGRSLADISEGERAGKHRFFFGSFLGKECGDLSPLCE